jgi:hypothetical protein
LQRSLFFLTRGMKISLSYYCGDASKFFHWEAQIRFTS